MTKEIEFYFDFISPYTYLAHKKIQSLPNNIKIKIGKIDVMKTLQICD